MNTTTSPDPVTEVKQHSVPSSPQVSPNSTGVATMTTPAASSTTSPDLVTEVKQHSSPQVSPYSTGVAEPSTTSPVSEVEQHSSPQLFQGDTTSQGSVRPPSDTTLPGDIVAGLEEPGTENLSQGSELSFTQKSEQEELYSQESQPEPPTIDWTNPFNDQLNILERAARGKIVDTPHYESEWKHFDNWLTQQGHRWGVCTQDILDNKLSSAALDYLMADYMSNRYNMTVYRQVKLLEFSTF